MRTQAASQLEAGLAAHDAAAALEGNAAGQGIAVGPSDGDLEEGATPRETVDPEELRALAAGMRELLRLKEAGNGCDICRPSLACMHALRLSHLIVFQACRPWVPGSRL